jgi:hypothetical protein
MVSVSVSLNELCFQVGRLLYNAYDSVFTTYLVLILDYMKSTTCFGRVIRPSSGGTTLNG